jgi:hypothetical protein
VRFTAWRAELSHFRFAGIVLVVKLSLVVAADLLERDGISIYCVESPDGIHMGRTVAGPFRSRALSDVLRIRTDDEDDFMVFAHAAVGEVASEVYGVEVHGLSSQR